MTSFGPRTLIACAAAVLLAGCVTSPVPLGAPAVHDLGLPSAVAATTAIPLRRIDVSAAPWLNTSEMQFRYRDTTRTERRSFADNRWAATPAQLLEPLLVRELGVSGAGECRLSLRLEEFVQLFDGQGGSEVLISGSASLRGGRGETIYARHEFDLKALAVRPDPAAGVVALRQASSALAEHIRGWLKGIPRTNCTVG